MTWLGPDGTGIRTVPRYAVEALKPGSTWETMAAFNRPAYIEAARAAGIVHPVGMCLQDAGWRFGPWLQREPGAYHPSEYVTWRQYFDTVAPADWAPDWSVSQEDIQVSLVWGAQVLQRIAQQVRYAETRLVRAEKLATLASVYSQEPWPGAELDEAWRTLLLAQHHDCWIVPYNGRRGNTWADKVRRWTDETSQTSEKVMTQAMKALSPPARSDGRYPVRVFNTLGSARTSLVSLALPADWTGAASVWNDAGRQLPSQTVTLDGHREVCFAASAPALGFNTFWLKKTPPDSMPGATALVLADGTVRVESDYYRAELDPKKGGTFRSLVAKKLGNRELVDAASPRSWNEIRGYFFQNRRFESSAETPARIEIVESGPVRVCLRVSSQIASNAVTQSIILAQGEPRLDLTVTIDWQGSPGIGADYHQSDPFRPEDDRKAFYDDRAKLLALFPLNLQHQKLFKDAPFDVTESRLTNTFFETWSGIKNNVILHWVDVYDAGAGIGVALLTDHTTSYAQGRDHPLGLTLQYSGVGLWGRNYSLQGPTTVRYAWLPHTGDWRAAALWTAGAAWSEPLVAQFSSHMAEAGASEQSLLTVENADWEVAALRIHDGNILVRLFNPSADATVKRLSYGARAASIETAQLNGQILKKLPLQMGSQGRSTFKLALPPKGIGTLRIIPGPAVSTVPR